MIQSTAKPSPPPVIGHTKVSENWHLYYDGKVLFFGLSELHVMREAKIYFRRKNHRESTYKFQQKARFYGTNRKSIAC